jgi:hypothetical protein
MSRFIFENSLDTECAGSGSANQLGSILNVHAKLNISRQLNVVNSFLGKLPVVFCEVTTGRRRTFVLKKIRYCPKSLSGVKNNHGGTVTQAVRVPKI